MSRIRSKKRVKHLNMGCIYMSQRTRVFVGSDRIAAGIVALLSSLFFVDRLGKLGTQDGTVEKKEKKELLPRVLHNARNRCKQRAQSSLDGSIGSDLCHSRPAVLIAMLHTYHSKLAGQP